MYIYDLSFETTAKLNKVCFLYWINWCFVYKFLCVQFIKKYVATLLAVGVILFDVKSQVFETGLLKKNFLNF